MEQLDLQDWLLLAGVFFLEAAALVLWWPAALILAGLFCLVFAWLIELQAAKLSRRAKRKHGLTEQ